MDLLICCLVGMVVGLLTFLALLVYVTREPRRRVD